MNELMCVCVCVQIDCSSIIEHAKIIVRDNNLENGKGVGVVGVSLFYCC